MRRSRLLDGPPQKRHAHHRVGRPPPLIAIVACRSRERLIHVLAGQDAERARDAGVELRLLDAARGLAANVVVVVRLAADHRTEARDPGEAPGLRAPLRGERELERTGDLERGDRRRADAAVVESQDRAVREPLPEIRVEGPDAGGEFEAAEDLAFGLGERISCAILSHPRRLPRQRPAPRARPGAAARSGSAPRRAGAPDGGACGRGAPAWSAGTPRCAGSEPPVSGAGPTPR